MLLQLTILLLSSISVTFRGSFYQQRKLPTLFLLPTQETSNIVSFPTLIEIDCRFVRPLLAPRGACLDSNGKHTFLTLMSFVPTTTTTIFLFIYLQILIHNLINSFNIWMSIQLRFPVQTLILIFLPSSLMLHAVPTVYAVNISLPVLEGATTSVAAWATLYPSPTTQEVKANDVLL